MNNNLLKRAYELIQHFGLVSSDSMDVYREAQKWFFDYNKFIIQQSQGEICSWCIDTADIEIKIEQGCNYCSRCGCKLSPVHKGKE